MERIDVYYPVCAYYLYPDRIWEAEVEVSAPLQNSGDQHRVLNIPVFNRDLFGSQEKFTRIGTGEIGGKANGLLLARNSLLSKITPALQEAFIINIPTLTVVGTDVFDLFIGRNRLDELDLSGMPDDRIAHAFQKAEFPTEIVGDLRGLIEKVHTPLAVRSSSLLEDTLFRPFAGVYGTKMIPNNEADASSRFKKLIEAIKFVYASVFFKEARDYIGIAGRATGDEKMAVIIQEVVGRRHDERFYPDISGVARSYNFYPFDRTCPDEGVVSLALGLGKTIVDGGRSWNYSPAYPKIGPPFGSASETMKQTQSEFWAVNMGKPPAYDPVRETEYLVRGNLEQADYDGTLDHIASTYVAQNDRIVMGTGPAGPRVLDFAPLLRLGEIPLNDLIRELLSVSTDSLGQEVEIEFALEMPTGADIKPRFGFLQVRPMVVSEGGVTVEEADLWRPDVLVASETVMGNGSWDSISDIVYVKPGGFLAKNTARIASEVEAMNSELIKAGRPYILIGFGRWGSSDPWLGIPVNWSQISGARVLVEATLPDMNVDPSQGSHFFHNMTSFQVCYFSVHHDGKYKINWDWLNDQPAIHETENVRHVGPTNGVKVRVDGKARRGVVVYG